jgi:hypothetical protein
MRFRKLRFAVSVVCAIACALLIALWIRSYWWTDLINCGPHRAIVFGQGKVCTLPIDFGPTRVGKRIESIHQVVVFREPSPTYFGFGYRYRNGWQFIAVPYWSMLLIVTVLGSSLWIRQLRWRFSLRTLLITTMAVAVALGLFVWAVR